MSDRFDESAAPLASPRFVQHPQLRIAGLLLRQLNDPPAELPALWQRFAPFIGRVPRQVPGVAFGVCMQAAQGEACSDDVCSDDVCSDYVAGCEVEDFAEIPVDWARVTIPPQRYAVFVHPGSASQLQHTVQAIFTQWLPRSGCEAVAPGPGVVGFFERYGPGFDPRTGSGDIELWLPLRSQPSA
jgi:AraC family transcriptional regulator